VRTFVHQHVPPPVVRPPAALTVGADAASLWSAVFGNTRPVLIEVGPGRGEFLLRSAREDPGRNYFAIERSRGRVREIERALGKRPALTNVRLINGDAACTLTLLPDVCVAGYFVLFPDPWWKVRHHRRRLLTPDFVATLRRTLVPGGLIHLASDVPGYFDVAQECLNADGGLQRIEAGPSPTPSTSFARKAQRLGTPIYRSIHSKRADG
jgi:tRNA (guanine-N7-)-methyltransferase